MNSFSSKLTKIYFLAVIIAGILFFPFGLNAYIGPGAGIALFGTLLTTFIGIILLILSVLFLPIRKLIDFLRKKRPSEKPLFRKVLVLGVDGLDPEMLKKFLAENKLPNIKKFVDEGCFHELRTTIPSLSPVAWSSFQTGVNPGKHNIFDFLRRVPKKYELKDSGVSISDKRKRVKIGGNKVPLGRPEYILERKSRAFWEILGEYNLNSTVLNVPLTFPVKKFKGQLLSGLGVPDLRGTQGESFLHTAEPEDYSKMEGTVVSRLKSEGNDNYSSQISGPENPFSKKSGNLQIPFSLKSKNEKIYLKIHNRKIKLRRGEYTDWIEIDFKIFPLLSIKGTVKFLLRKEDPPELYQTPVNISPSNPAVTISHPALFSRYLYYLYGNFPTLGFAEDTWGLINKVITEDEFLEQCYSNFSERKEIFLGNLKNHRRGLLSQVFDLTDRIQHLFIDSPEKIEKAYREIDALIGEVNNTVDKSTLVLVVSDHGFKNFKWEVNISNWLNERGYISIGEDETEANYFNNYNWQETTAYSFGYNGIYINRKDREPIGTVETEKVRDTAEELRGRLLEIENPHTGEKILKNVYLKEEIYEGPYVEDAPELILGYRPGYRTSWDSVLGKINEFPVITENKKKWMGDHSFNPPDVPGVILSGKEISTDEPEITDIAPTILRAFGISAPEYMDGRSLLK